MNIIEKQRVLDVLNNLEVIEENGGEDAYLLVENNEKNQRLLNDAGVTTETINKYGDIEHFCILALAFSENIANGFENGKLIVRPNQFAVYDSVSGDINFHDTYGEALKEYEAAKDYVFEDIVSGDEKVYIFEVKKVASLVEDTNQENPKDHGFDKWLKWQDTEVNE